MIPSNATNVVVLPKGLGELEGKAQSLRRLSNERDLSGEFTRILHQDVS